MLNNDDLVSAFLDEQARLNFAVDDGDVNNLVADLVQVNTETVGMTESTSVTNLGTNGVYKYDDGLSKYGFALYI